MCQSTMRVIKGMMVGLAVGMAAGVCGYCYWQQHHRGIKRCAGRALRNISDLVDTVTTMF